MTYELYMFTSYIDHVTESPCISGYHFTPTFNNISDAIRFASDAVCDYIELGDSIRTTEGFYQRQEDKDAITYGEGDLIELCHYKDSDGSVTVYAISIKGENK